MLRLGLKFSALLLMGVLVAPSALAIAAFHVPPQAAPCHEQSHSKPNQPVNYRCCITGHSPALQPDVTTSFVPSADVATVSVELVRSLENPVVDFSRPTASPPPLISLRI